MKTTQLTILIFVLLLGINAAWAQNHLYVTWEGLEPDKIASAWLLKRHVDTKAEFEFIPKGELIEKGTPFDTPDAEFRRYHNLSCYGSIIQKHKITDQALLQIGTIIHDIEINYWGRKRNEKSHLINLEIRELTKGVTDWQKGLGKGFLYFDELYKKLKTQ